MNLTHLMLSGEREGLLAKPGKEDVSVYSLWFSLVFKFIPLFSIQIQIEKIRPRHDSSQIICHEFKANLCYLLSSRSAWATV